MNRICVRAASAALLLGVVAPSTGIAADWSTAVRNEISAVHSYPRSAQVRGDEGTAKIRISVAADGSIQNVELIEATGSKILDREAIRIPSKIGKLPVPPSKKPTDLIIPITWKLS